MSAIVLDRMTWPDVKAEVDRGRATVVVAAPPNSTARTRRWPTDALIGDHLARRIAERLDAFVALTPRIGCSEHHLEFPGTLSVSQEPSTLSSRTSYGRFRGVGVAA